MSGATFERESPMKSVWTRVIAATMLLATTMVLPGGSTIALAQDQAPDATFRYTGGTAAAGIGVSWGQGILTFQGKEYPFRMRGVDFGSLGGGKVSATGNVYNLKTVGAFSGTYASASAGAALAGGAAGTAMKNDRDVVIRMKSATEGVQLKLAVEGATIELDRAAQ